MEVIQNQWKKELNEPAVLDYLTAIKAHAVQFKKKAKMRQLAESCLNSNRLIVPVGNTAKSSWNCAFAHCVQSVSPQIIIQYCVFRIIV
jgi:hypothetical protein